MGFRRQDYRERIPNTGQYDLVICILWSRLEQDILGVRDADGTQPTCHRVRNCLGIDQTNRTPGFPELHLYRNQSTPVAKFEPKEERDRS